MKRTGHGSGAGAERAHPLVSGQTVTGGEFRCVQCGQVHTVPEARVENLPVCPRCQNETWDAR